MGNKAQVLAFGAHPDDVEACAAGLLLQAKEVGYTTGIVDLTRGEGSNFGSVPERDQEAEAAKDILQLDYRENLSIPDLEVSSGKPEYVQRVVEVIRDTAPEIVLFPYVDDIHPDHAGLGVMGRRASFFSRVKKYTTGGDAGPHQPGIVLHYMLHTEFRPSFILDVSKQHDTKMRGLLAHRSQFFRKEDGHEEYSSDFHNPDFIEFLEARSRLYGYKIGVRWGEPYRVQEYLGLRSIEHLSSGGFRSLAPLVPSGLCMEG